MGRLDRIVSEGHREGPIGSLLLVHAAALHASADALTRAASEPTTVQDARKLREDLTDAFGDCVSTLFMGDNDYSVEGPERVRQLLGDGRMRIEIRISGKLVSYIEMRSAPGDRFENEADDV